jgi:FlaA1/EpsC-like NDP-sugar epimerase
VAFGLKISDFYSRVWAISWLLSAAGALSFARYVLSFVTLRWAKQGRFAFRTVIVGVGEQADMLAAHIVGRGDARTRIIAFVDDRPGPPRPRRTFHGHPVIPDLARMMASSVKTRLMNHHCFAVESGIASGPHAAAAASVRIRLAPGLLGFRFADRL